MYILDRPSISTLTEILLEDLPRVVLEACANYPRSPVGTIVARVVEQFPMHVDTGEVRERCVSSLRWFIHHGDVARTGTSRYTVVPPYAVVIRSSQKSLAVLRLFGDLSLDVRVISITRRFGGRFEAETVPWKWDNADESADAGYTRTAFLPQLRLDAALDGLVGLNLPIIDISELAQSLPRIESVMVPPAQCFVLPPPNWGFWDIYRPELLRFDRWEKVVDWRENSFGILRWKPTNDWRGEESTRYFFSKGTEYLAELGSTLARLWMLKLDHTARNPRRMWLWGRRIWVPTIIPEPQHQWLQIASEDWHRSGDHHFLFYLDSRSEFAEQRIAETLGLEVVHSPPSF